MQNTKDKNQKHSDERTGSRKWQRASDSNLTLSSLALPSPTSRQLLRLLMPSVVGKQIYEIKKQSRCCRKLILGKIYDSIAEWISLVTCMQMF